MRWFSLLLAGLAVWLCAGPAAAQRASVPTARPISALAAHGVRTPAPSFALVGRATPRTRRAGLDNPHGDIAIPCEACHTASGWTPLRDSLAFAHNRDTAFPLAGRHQQADCASCHLDLRFDAPDAAPADCATCHLDIHRGTLGDDCQACHGTTDFGLVNGQQVHARTAFPLTGSHLQVSCDACHAGGAGGALGPALGALPTDCYACHADDYAATSLTAVDHAAAGFPTDCEACHSTVAFAGEPFNHPTVAQGFALVGAHAALPCSACHTATLDPLFQPAGQDDCLTCHASDAAAAPVDHSAFPTTCTTCHTTDAWPGATGDHVLLSGGFPLRGAHTALDCQTCHTGAGFDLPWTPTGPDDCQSCHAADAAAATPSHAGFPATCTTCHSESAWPGAVVDHPAVSGGFALVGTHATLACETCHANPDFSLPWTPASQDDCQSCHADDAAAAQPDHSSFPTTCATCHTTSAWPGAVIDHVAVSGGFALVGAHATAVACQDCHSNPDYSLPWTPAGPDDCQSCHAEDAAAATPPHTAFPTTCTECHSVETWAGASVDHPAVSGGFALVGAHAAISCETCHVNPDFSLPWNPAGQDDCLTCHADDAAAASPSHDSFPETCTACHGVDAWAGATVDHPALSGGFALVGSHAAIACTACHANPDFSLPWTPANQDDCQSCHADDAAGATPDHTPFPTTCASCHTTTAWPGATVDHVQISGGFALVGAHAPLACQTCHSGPGGSVPWTPASQNDCIACHADDYDDEHAGSGFPTTCLDCHSVNTWDGATFTHPQFPIYSGEHAGEWDSCQTCHTQPGTFAVFSCLTCHEHRQSEMDDEHEDENGYVYESNACYSCHPDGRADDDLFRLSR